MQMYCSNVGGWLWWADAMESYVQDPRTSKCCKLNVQTFCCCSVYWNTLYTRRVTYSRLQKKVATCREEVVTTCSSRLRELLAYEVRKLELATASRWSSRRSQAGARDSVTIETPAISRLESRSHVCMYV